MTKFEAVELSVAVIDAEVTSLLDQHPETQLPGVAAAIRAVAVRYAEGLLCLMSVDELCSDAPQHEALRKAVRREIQNHVSRSISGLSPGTTTWRN